MAHDLNNILSGIVSYPELLLLEIPEESPLRKPVLTIKQSGEKAATIVQDLLTLARRSVPVSRVENLNTIISEYLSSPEHFRMMSFHPEVIVQTDLRPDLFNITGSKVHLSKVVMNLTSNAAESMPKGGVIHISTRNRYVDAPIQGYEVIKEGDFAILEISDTGGGISAADRERIFEPFYSRKMMGRSGSGLGMSVVWSSIKDHKGYIDVHSAEGRGTTFTLYFPVTNQIVEKEKVAFSLAQVKGNGESILVVDDVREQRIIATSILEKMGYSVAAVSRFSAITPRPSPAVRRPSPI